MAEGREIFSIIHGSHPVKPSSHRPPVYIKGEWGILQREARRGATFGRAETTSNELKWAQVAMQIHLHRRQNFRSAHRTKTPKPPPTNQLNIKYRTRKAKPKKGRDLAKLQSLNKYIANEFHKVDRIVTEIALIDSKVGCCVATERTNIMEDCRVSQGCSQSSSCCVSPPSTPMHKLNAKITQMEEEMEKCNKQM